jgi:hypothetical protein
MVQVGVTTKPVQMDILVRRLSVPDPKKVIQCGRILNLTDSQNLVKIIFEFPFQ